MFFSPHDPDSSLKELRQRECLECSFLNGPYYRSERTQAEGLECLYSSWPQLYRSERTQAETLKLKRIQKELQALDDMVSADIGILRNRIDQASLNYSHAR